MRGLELDDFEPLLRDIVSFEVDFGIPEVRIDGGPFRVETGICLDGRDSASNEDDRVLIPS